jgi:endonuclease YncB( thermonuclease family)
LINHVTLALAGAISVAVIGSLGAAETPTGPAQVIDADSIVVEGRELRIAGIDTPEWDQTCTAPGNPGSAGGSAEASPGP